jgi:hypothetical protein
VNVGVADGFTQLVFHLLAHVRRAGPGDLFDRTYVAWVREVFAGEVQRQLEEDAAVLSALWRGSPALDVLDVVSELHGSLASFGRTASRALADVRADEVAGPEVLRALQEIGAPGELVHAAFGLLAGDFARVLEESIGPGLRVEVDGLAAVIAGLAAWVPGLAEARVEVVWALGGRGRAMPGRILIGRGADAGIVAAHEMAVCASGQVDYVRAEWAALVRLAGWLREAPAELRAMHARWLAGLELTGLVAAAVAEGLVAAEDGARVVREREARAEALARLAG